MHCYLPLTDTRELSPPAPTPVQISFPYGMLIPAGEVRWTGAVVLDLIAAKSRALITSCSLETVSILAKEPCQSGGCQPGSGTAARPAAEAAVAGRLLSWQRASPRRPHSAVLVTSLSAALPKERATPAPCPWEVEEIFLSLRGWSQGTSADPTIKQAVAWKGLEPCPRVSLWINKTGEQLRHWIRSLECKWKDHPVLLLLPVGSNDHCYIGWWQSLFLPCLCMLHALMVTSGPFLGNTLRKKHLRRAYTLTPTLSILPSSWSHTAEGYCPFLTFMPQQHLVFWLRLNRSKGYESFFFKAEGWHREAVGLLHLENCVAHSDHFSSLPDMPFNFLSCHSSPVPLPDCPVSLASFVSSSACLSCTQVFPSFHCFY